MVKRKNGGKFTQIAKQSKTILNYFAPRNSISKNQSGSVLEESIDISLLEPIIEIDCDSAECSVLSCDSHDDDIEVLSSTLSFENTRQDSQERCKVINSRRNDISTRSRILNSNYTPSKIKSLKTPPNTAVDPNGKTRLSPAVQRNNNFFTQLKTTPKVTSVTKKSATSPRGNTRKISLGKSLRIKKALSFDSGLPLIESTSSNIKFPPYYLSNFQHLAFLSIYNADYKYLFDQQDLKYAKSFSGMSTEAQKLYARLFQRKNGWFRGNRLKYEEISVDLNIYFEELTQLGLLDCDDDTMALGDMFNHVTLPELKSICKELKIEFSTRKEDTVEHILKMSKKYTGIFGSKSFGSIVQERTGDVCGSFYRMNQEARSVFLRGIVLSSLPRYSENDVNEKSLLLTQLFASMGKLTFPDYPIIRKTRIFQERKDFIKFVEALEDNSRMMEYMVDHDWDGGISVCCESRSQFDTILQDAELRCHDESLYPFLRYYTAGSVYCHILSLGVEVYQKARKYKEANELLHYLTEQNVYLTDYKGRWFDRMALNYEQHLKDKKEAFTVIKRALKDSSVKFYHRLSLCQRAKKLAQSKKGSFSLDGLDLMEISEFPKVVLTGRQLPRQGDNIGLKSSFVHPGCDSYQNTEELTICSVEEFVIGHYKKNGFLEGIHGESSTFHSIAGLLFWDIIYNSHIQDVFLGPYQYMPIDISSTQFYESRKCLIDNQFASLRVMSITELQSIVEENWDKHYGKCSLVHWEIFKSLEHLKGLLLCFDVDVILGVCDRLLKHFRFTRSGMPDIVVWNPITLEYKICEVKGPNDKLSTKQMLWLDYLHSIGANAEVCHVQAIGFKHIVQQDDND